jgi:ABC-type branched-subunit amino acid transport system permease subunit
MAVFGVIGGVGRTVGPIIGAFFAEPAKTMPRVFRNTVFETYPFALPSVVLAVNCAVVMGMAYVMLQETLVFPDAIGCMTLVCSLTIFILV